MTLKKGRPTCPFIKGKRAIVCSEGVSVSMNAKKRQEKKRKERNK
jgi:hypothetical protein